MKQISESEKERIPVLREHSVEVFVGTAGTFDSHSLGSFSDLEVVVTESTVGEPLE